MAKHTGPSNPLMQDLIKELKRKSFEQGVGIWKRVAEDLEKPARQRRIINLYKINKNTKDKDTVIVPGKVLGAGELDHVLTIAAYKFSSSALDKISGSKSKAITITELMKDPIKGKKVRIIG